MSESAANPVMSVARVVRLRVKVVPGASRSRVVGLLGDRIKVAAAAPAESGKANRAVCRLLADALGVASRAVTIVEGRTNPLKCIEVAGVDAASARKALGLS